jgi:photosystem II stability/assembly factor-like uncharacterized protein
LAYQLRGRDRLLLRPQQFCPSPIAVAIAFTTFGLVSCTHSRLPSGCLTASSTPLISALVASGVAAPQSESYSWSNVAIEGMGFVTGLIIHPYQPDLVYVRTDVGGAYRWNDGEWVQLMDAERDRYGIESIALDPNQPNVIYAATGAYTSNSGSDILKSTDQGRTWAATHLKTPTGESVRMGSNEEWRWAGERLAVDPNNSQILYFGSRLDGLYRSTDGAKSWHLVENFPSQGTHGGIAFVVFDSRSAEGDRKSSQQSQVLYVGVMGSGVYRSLDGGETWTSLAGTPDGQNAQQAVVASDGTLYVTFFASQSSRGGGVWQYRSGQQAERWTEITPDPNKNYSAITIDPHQPTHVLVGTYPLSPEGIYRSIDGGQHWQTITLNVGTPSWWPNWHLYTLMGSLAIDPHYANRVWLTNGFGVLRTDNIAANPSNWSACMTNLEESVTFVVKSPPLPEGAPLLSGIADMDGFRHESLTQVPARTHDNSKFGDTTGMDFSEADPNIVVRVGSSPGDGGREDSQERSAYSSDNGRTWQPFENVPSAVNGAAVNGKVAVSATLQTNGYPIIVWAPQGDVYPHRSLDGGKTWLSTQGAPNRTTLQLWFPSQAIASDRVDGSLFYLYKYNEAYNQGAFYRSTDGGATWSQTASGLPDHWLHSVKAAPEMPGEVWLSVQGNPLYRSSDAGTSFTKLAQVQDAENFAFGKAAPGRRNPTVFVYGKINQIEGLFRSDDVTSLPGDAAEASWVKVSTARQLLSNVTYLEGDRLIFGRVYVGTGGRGILYGQPDSP